MSETQILDKVLTFIIDAFLVEIDEIPLDESLMDAGIIDSFGLFELVDFVEAEFSMTVTDDQLTRDNFGSVNKLVKFIAAEQRATGN